VTGPTDKEVAEVVLSAMHRLAGPAPKYGEDEAAERERLKAIMLLRARLRDEERTARASIAKARERRRPPSTVD
jgi:hypothetical protein